MRRPRSPAPAAAAVAAALLAAVAWAAVVAAAGDPCILSVPEAEVDRLARRESLAPKSYLDVSYFEVKGVKADKLRADGFSEALITCLAQTYANPPAVSTPADAPQGGDVSAAGVSAQRVTQAQKAKVLAFFSKPKNERKWTGKVSTRFGVGTSRYLSNDVMYNATLPIDPGTVNSILDLLQTALASVLPSWLSWLFPAIALIIQLAMGAAALG